MAADDGVFLIYQGAGRQQVESIISVVGKRGQIGHNIPVESGPQLGAELVVVDKDTGAAYHYASMESLGILPWAVDRNYGANFPVIYNGFIRVSKKGDNTGHQPIVGENEWWGAPISFADLLAQSNPSGGFILWVYKEDGYPANSLLIHNGVICISKTNNNAAEPGSVDDANWQTFSTVGAYRQFIMDRLTPWP